MKKYKAVLLDDEELCTKALEMEIAAHCPQIEIRDIFHDPTIALPAVLENPPDILFLDIEMPFLNGFDFLNKLGKIDFCVVFTTAYNEFALDAFKVNAVDYLLKPIDGQELVLAVQKVIERLDHSNFSKGVEKLIQKMVSTRSTGTLCLPTTNGYEFVDIEDVIYCKSDNNYCHIHIKDERSKLVSRTLKDISKQLNSDQFLRIHQSYLINLDWVKAYSRIDGGTIIMKDGSSLPISRTKKDMVLGKLRKDN
jgi:two-component system LytT family response regulator